mmetsp:Transcript_2537/g.9296  ORF Transcript_2537/g.9296 Transcript_2537/m.9296 type:complete len:437 (-) Transcript_2537:269-1579(-)
MREAREGVLVPPHELSVSVHLAKSVGHRHCDECVAVRLPLRVTKYVRLLRFVVAAVAPVCFCRSPRRGGKDGVRISGVHASSVHGELNLVRTGGERRRQTFHHGLLSLVSVIEHDEVRRPFASGVKLEPALDEIEAVEAVNLAVVPRRRGIVRLRVAVAVEEAAAHAVAPAAVASHHLRRRCVVDDVNLVVHVAPHRDVVELGEVRDRVEVRLRKGGGGRDAGPVEMAKLVVVGVKQLGVLVRAPKVGDAGVEVLHHVVHGIPFPHDLAVWRVLDDAVVEAARVHVVEGISGAVAVGRDAARVAILQRAPPKDDDENVPVRENLDRVVRRRGAVEDVALPRKLAVRLEAPDPRSRLRRAPVAGPRRVGLVVPLAPIRLIQHHKRTLPTRDELRLVDAHRRRRVPVNHTPIHVHHRRWALVEHDEVVPLLHPIRTKV